MSDSDTQPYITKPMTLYVSGVYNTDGHHHGKVMERIVDVELSKEQARELIKILLKDIHTIPGSKSFRLKGRLIL